MNKKIILMTSSFLQIFSGILIFNSISSLLDMKKAIIFGVGVIIYLGATVGLSQIIISKLFSDLE